ncbi:hypothetical protein DY000_02028386 [Brassica cretica]|uniref:Uncharacterized protein n=1 Tax=Brassica cretica TaxID=69181 RepID=A0ABQ7DJL0_BRACR|nr:hypothetical protein DY000_02028386 [Brassica cretica]
MASRNSVAGFALFTFVFAVFSSLAGAQTLAPAPAPTSDGNSHRISPSRSESINRSRSLI